MTRVRVGPDGPVLGFVDGVPVSAELLETRIRVLYQGQGSSQGQGASALPVAGTREGRQFRRWVAQVVLTEALLDAECRRRGLSPESAVVADLDGVGRVELGSVDAAALESSAAARAVYRALTADVTPTAAEIAEYGRWYADRYGTAEVRVVSHVLGADPVGLASAVSTAERMDVRPGDLPAPVDAVIFAADPGEWSAPVRSALGWHLVRVEQVRAAAAPDPARVRALVVAELTPGVRRRRYRGWVDWRRAAAVRVSRGYEHPADPGQPDHLHQH